MSEPLDLDAIRPCKGRNSNVCVGEGCFGDDCLKTMPLAYRLADALDEVTRLRAELDAEREGHREQRAAAHPEFDAFKDRALLDPEVRASYEAAERGAGQEESVVIRAAKGTALREAADAMVRNLCSGLTIQSVHWLRERADQIEAGDG